MPATAANRWNSRMLAWPIWGFSAAAVLFSLVKLGFTVRALQPDPISSFPTPQPTWSTLSYGMRTIAWIGKWEDPIAYAWISIAISVISILVILIAANKFLPREQARIAILLLLTSPIAVVLYNNQGRHDALMILGSLLLGFLGRNLWWSIAAAIVMIAANPEQALLATMILFACSFTSLFREWRKGAATAFAMTIVAFVLLSLWAQASDIGSRASYIKSLFGNSIYGFFSNFGLSIYSGFGILWILVIYLIAQQNRKHKSLLLVFLLAVPFIFTMITLDQTRVFVGVTAAVSTALVLQVTPKITDEVKHLGIKNLLFWTFIAALLMPAFEVSVSHVVRPPFAWTFEVLLPQIQRAIGF